MGDRSIEAQVQLLMQGTEYGDQALQRAIMPFIKPPGFMHIYFF